MYEIFEHTADLGLRIRADDLQGLFEEAARGLFSVVVTISGRATATFSVGAVMAASGDL